MNITKDEAESVLNKTMFILLDLGLHSYYSDNDLRKQKEIEGIFAAASNDGNTIEATIAELSQSTYIKDKNHAKNTRNKL